MSALTPLIQRIRAPIEIEQLDVVLDAVEDDFRSAYTALNHQIRAHLAIVEEAAVQVQAQRDTVGELFHATDAKQGLLSTLRTTLAQERVDEVRSRALQHLNNGIKQLGTQLRLARLYQADARDFIRDQTELCAALDELATRAHEASLLDAAASVRLRQHSLSNVPDTLTPAADQLWDSCASHCTTYTELQDALGALSNERRAETLGEKLGSQVLPSSDAPIADLVRDAAPEWMKRKADTDAAFRPEDDFALSDDALRQEAALRRAAEAELDALE